MYLGFPLRTANLQTPVKYFVIVHPKKSPIQ